MRPIYLSSLFAGIVILIGLFSSPLQAQHLIQFPKTKIDGNHISPQYLNYSSGDIQNDDPLANDYHGLRAGTIAGQYLVGAFLGGVSGYIGGLVSVAFLNCSGDWCVFGEFFGGAFVGYTFGSALGVYLIGNNPSRKASYPAVLLGDAMGLGAGLIILDNYANGTTEFQKYLVGTAVLSLPIIGAILGYSLSQRPRLQGQQSSLLSISNNHLTIAPPALAGLHSSPLLQNQIIPGISIVNFKF